MDKLLGYYNYFNDNKKDIVEKYGGMFVVITGDGVVGSFVTEMEAYTHAKAKYGLGNFIIQPCIANEEEYTHTFYSPIVSF